MHTLPLPGVRTDEDPKSKQNVISSCESPRRQGLAAGQAAQPSVRLPGLNATLTAACGNSIDTTRSFGRQASSGEARLSDIPASSPRGSCLSSQQLQFLLRVAPPALAAQHEFQVPACVTIAQAILESATPQLGWGSSVIFRTANNPRSLPSWSTATGSTTHAPSNGLPRDETPGR